MGGFRSYTPVCFVRPVSKDSSFVQSGIIYITCMMSRNFLRYEFGDGRFGEVGEEMGVRLLDMVG